MASILDIFSETSMQTGQTAERSEANRNKGEEGRTSHMLTKTHNPPQKLHDTDVFGLLITSLSNSC